MRSVKTKTANTSANTDRPVHYINFTCSNTGDKLGYMTLDGSNDKSIDNTALIELCQEHDEYAQFYFGNEHINARYSQAGVSKAAQPKSKEEMLKAFMATKA